MKLKLLISKKLGVDSKNLCYLSDGSKTSCAGQVLISENKICIRTPFSKVKLDVLAKVPHIGKTVVSTRLLSNLNNNENLESLLEIPDETKTLFQAKQKIQKNINNKENILFGCQMFNPDCGENNKKIFLETFDMGIAPLYFFLIRPTKNNFDWDRTDRTDRIVAWLNKHNKIIKGHPLVWFHPKATPNWLKKLSFHDLKIVLSDHVFQVVSRYKNEIRMWDIVNEFSVQDANGLNLDLEQLVELTSVISKAVERADPSAEKIINLSDPFGSNSWIHKKPGVPPELFIKTCIDSGINFQSIGLQFYFGARKELVCRNLTNISETVDKFFIFKKGLHISELGWPSKFKTDPTSFFADMNPIEGGFWHKPWTEKIQAEFLTNLFTIFASKSNLRSITWWDLTDMGNNENISGKFIPFGGLTRRNGQPKQALKNIVLFKKMLKGDKV